jgi:hypothetical protein
MYPSREQIYIYYGVERKKSTHFTITLIMTLISVAVPCVYPDIVGLLGLLGGITVGTSGYTIPYLLKVKSLKHLSWYSPGKLPYVMILFTVIFLSVGSCYVSLTQGGGGH